MSSKKKMVLVLGICLLNMSLLIGFLIIRDKTLLNTLKREETELLKIDMTSGNYQRKLQSRGDYATVEKAIKEYLDDYADTLQEANGLMSDSTLTTILSYDNYCSDGPEFTKSLDYLKNTKESFNKKVDWLNKHAEDEEIKKGGTKYLKNDYYIDLYNEFMLSSSMKEKYSESLKLLSDTKVKVNEAIDVSNEVLNFLIANKDSWKVEDGKIQFLTQDLYNQYVGYTSKVSKPTQ